jgi:hypothetical protein
MCGRLTGHPHSPIVEYDYIDGVDPNEGCGTLSSARDLLLSSAVQPHQALHATDAKPAFRVPEGSPQGFLPGTPEDRA